jgi:hypothetical protein
MPNTLDQYRQAKQDILKLHGAAKKELIARFNELANELLLVQKELREEFGVKMAVPSKPKAARAKRGAPATKREATKAPIDSPEVSMLEKKLVTQKRKLDEASKNGKPEKSIQDRIYELEDELRLARDR